MDFLAKIASMGSTPFTEAVCGAYRVLFEASEGDARRYMKKVLEELGYAGSLRSMFGERWTERAFNLIRDYFVHKGCDVYFVPGIARIVFGDYDELNDPDLEMWDGLREIVKFITRAHKGDFTRNLAMISTVAEGPRRGMRVAGRPLEYGELAEMFSRDMAEAEESEREEFEGSAMNSPTGYEVFELKDFEQAQRYLPYTPESSPWCYLQSRDTFEDYRDNGNRLYMAVYPGFEKLEPGDPGYGRSMIGFDMGPVGKDGKSRLKVCNNRYNHSEDLEHENDRTGDSKYTEIELAEILGLPIWTACPGYTEEEMIANGHVNREILERMIPTAEALYAAYQYRRDEFREKYGIELDHRIYSDMRPFLFTSVRTNNIVCYAVADYRKDTVTFFDMYRRLGYGRCAITAVGRGDMMVDEEDGRPVSDGWFWQIGVPGVYTFPAPVARKTRGGDAEWNYITVDGEIVLDRWYPHVGGSYDNKLLVTENDGKSTICRMDGSPVVPPADTVRHMVEAQCDLFLVGYGGKYNYLVHDEWLFGEWLDAPMAEGKLYQAVLDRNARQGN